MYSAVVLEFSVNPPLCNISVFSFQFPVQYLRILFPLSKVVQPDDSMSHNQEGYNINQNIGANLSHKVIFDLFSTVDVILSILSTGSLLLRDGTSSLYDGVEGDTEKIM